MTPAPYPISAEAIAMLSEARRDARGTGTLSPEYFTRFDDAVAHANAGRTADASAILAALLATADDPRLLFVGFQFFFRTGDLDQAESLTRRRIAIAEARPPDNELARAHSNLGLILFTRGDLTLAEASLRQALEISTALNDPRSIARDLGNLSLVPESRAGSGDLELAESLNLDALAIARRIGAEDIVATRLANLGDLALRRGARETARAYWVEAVDLLGRVGKPTFHADYAAKLAALGDART